MSDRSKALVEKIIRKYGKKGDGKFHLPVNHTPYMVLSKGGDGPFSCANCVSHFEKDGEHHCSSPDYQEYTGGSLLKDKDGKPLDDPSRACSDWFFPNKDVK